MSVTYYKAAGQPSFSTVATVGLPVWDRPFEDLNDKILFRQRFMQEAAQYSPLALNTTYTAHGQYGVPTSSSYFLVGEEGFTGERGGLLSWDRVYAAVPTVRVEYSAQPFQFPAIIQELSAGTYSSVTLAGVSSPELMYINGVTANPGERVVLSYSASGLTVNTQVYVRDYAYGTLAPGLIVDLIPNFITSTFPRSAARLVPSVTISRDEPAVLLSRAKVEYDYALIPVNGDPADTWTPSSRFVPRIAGREISFVSSATDPTSTQYASWVANGTYIRMLDDTWSRWRGNIYERKQSYIAAL